MATEPRALATVRTPGADEKVAERMAQYAQAVDQAAQPLLACDPAHSMLYEMLRYHLGWDAGAPAGKRLRPAVCLTVAEMLCGDWRPALPAATAIELIHNFSLIHDDIQDRSELRRFRPTVWAKWGIAQGINAGDALLVTAYQALMDVEPHLDAETATGAFLLLSRACRALCEGQYLDISWEAAPAIQVDQYLGMINRKTAWLFRCACELGAYCAHAPADAQRDVAEFGTAVGMAFQVADDLLGVWGPEVATGKTANLDVANRKKTLPTVFGLCSPPSVSSDRLRALFALGRSLTPDETREATDLLDALGVRGRSIAMAMHYRDEAIEHLDRLGETYDISFLRDLVGATLPGI